MALKRWVWIVLGLCACLFVGCLAVVGTGIYYVSKHVDRRTMSPAEIEAEVATIRNRFKDQQPLLELRDGGAVSTTRLEERASTYEGPLPTGLHILAWERGDKARVHLTIPMWLLKLKVGDGMNFDIDEAGIEKIRIDADDLERAGPALLVDFSDKRQRVLMWTQ